MRKDAQLNQEKILTAARQLFDQRGVAGVSMKDIAVAAGIGPGTLYRHYAHKSTLCLALVTDRVATFVTRYQGYLETTTDTAEMQFNTVVGAYLRIREANVALLASVEAGEPGRLQFYESDLYRGLADMFQRVIAGLTPGLSPQARQFRADMLIAMLKSTSYAFQRQQRQLTPTQILTELRRLMQ